jgi:hypothetical protein
MAARSGLSKSMIGRIWKAFGLQPHRSEDVNGTRDIVAGRAVRRFKADAVAEESGSSAVR